MTIYSRHRWTSMQQIFPNECSISFHSQYTTISEPHWSEYHHPLCERYKVKRIDLAQVQSSINQLDNVYAPFTPHYHFYIQEGNILQQLDMNAPKQHFLNYRIEANFDYKVHWLMCFGSNHHNVWPHCPIWIHGWSLGGEGRKNNGILLFETNTISYSKTRKHSSRIRTAACADHMCFMIWCHHQWGKFEQVSNDGHQMSLAGGRGRGSWGERNMLRYVKKSDQNE